MSKRSLKDLFFRIVLFYFVLLTPFSVMGYMYYNYRTDRYLLVSQKDQQTGIQLQISKLKELFRHVNANLLTGANHPMAFNIFSVDPTKKDEAFQRLEVFCGNMLEYNGIFSQARYIDVDGKEVLNVRYENGKSITVPDTDLQVKSHRYYMQDAQALSKDGIYVSKLDLNVDRGEIEHPQKPVIRFITPIIDDGGERYGYFILNLLGTNLINGLKSIGDEDGWVNYMVNDEGYFIVAGDPEFEWRYMFGEDSVNKINEEQRLMYDLFTKKEAGVETNEKGIYVFSTINAKDLLNDTGNNVVHKDSWMMVSRLPNEAIMHGLRSLFQVTDIVLVVFIAIVLMTVAGFLVITTHKQRQIQLQLTASEKELRVANRTKDKFISILAHDLKNPLASIMGFVDLLKEGYEQMPQKSKDIFIKSLENSTHLLLRLIDDVLSWARSSTGSMNVEREPFLVNKMLENAITFSEMQAEKKNISLIKNYNDKVIGLADQRMIETVIRNLISNAIKFSYHGGNILIEMAEDTGQVVISVVDYGVGIEEKRIKELFKLDQLASTPGTGKEKGTGMGLILCQDFITKNSGEINVYSKVGRGSRFTINFPAYAND